MVFSLFFGIVLLLSFNNSFLSIYLSFQTNGGGKARFENVHGSCVVCGLSYVMEQELWHHIDEYIKPPNLLVSLQWVCVSLSIQPTNLPQEEKEKGKVSVNMSIYLYCVFGIQELTDMESHTGLRIGEG